MVHGARFDTTTSGLRFLLLLSRSTTSILTKAWAFSLPPSGCLLQYCTLDSRPTPRLSKGRLSFFVQHSSFAQRQKRNVSCRALSHRGNRVRYSVCVTKSLGSGGDTYCTQEKYTLPTVESSRQYSLQNRVKLVWLNKKLAMRAVLMGTKSCKKS